MRRMSGKGFRRFGSAICIMVLCLCAGCGKKVVSQAVSAAQVQSAEGVQGIQGKATSDFDPLMLVNRWHPIPDDYTVDLITLYNGEAVDSRIYDALQAMFDAARAEGVYPVVTSGYRTHEKQQQLMDDKICAYEDEGFSENDAQEIAKQWVAVPGTSEHEMGIAADINADGVRSNNDEVYAWMQENAYKYGFIERYPEDKSDITGVSNEPWHYRYVGEAAAQAIYEQGICLEEYLGEL